MPKQEKPLNQAEVVEELVGRTGLEKRHVKDFLAHLHDLVLEQLNKKGIGEIRIPNLDVKLTVIKKPATKAHKGRNPFTGEEIMVAAKPARKVIKIKPMKKLKDAVA